METTLQKAIAYHQSGKLSQAQAIYQKIVQKEKDNADAWHLLGVLFYQMGEMNIAENNILRAIGLNPNSASYYSNLGLVYHQQGKEEKAIASYQKALALQPEYPEALNNLGNSLKTLGLKGSQQHQEALVCYQKALQLHSAYPDALNNLATLLSEYGKYEEALGYYESALRLVPNHKDAITNMGVLLYRAGSFAQAASVLQQALTLPGPVNVLALCTLFEAKRQACMWDGLETLEKELLTKGLDDKDETLIDPFVTVAKLTEVSKAQQMQLIRKNIKQHTLLGREITPFDHKRKIGGEKIRLGYVSADLYDHATMHLIQGLFASHDRQRFDVTLFTLHKDEASGYFERVSADVDRVIDLAALNDSNAAERIRDERIDILIDINGLTKNARTPIFAYRPAPLQVQYLAYPGTMGCDFIDYMITDEVITPEEDAAFFSEKFLYMPDCYQVNDREQPIDDVVPSRNSCGLPDDAFVYCSFNASYKIEPRIFDAWIEILKANKSSVLWLLADNEEAKANLRAEAKQKGVDPSRLVFAAKLPKPAHLARLKNADLMLDTYYCNAHTTASDALYTGVPIITCKGDRMASRVAASILAGIGLRECIMYDLEEYTTLAIKLGQDKEILRGISMRLKENKETYPLFDTKRFARNMEHGLLSAWENYLGGGNPQTIKVRKEVQS